MKPHPGRRLFARVAGTLTMLCLCGIPAAEDLLLEEILVTAQKREQSAQDVGISITALSGEQIRELGMTNTIDLAAQTPGLNVIQFHPTLTTMVIRGISQNDFADHLEPPIAFYVDDAYVSAMGAGHTQLFDLERVEVLRGPQGTLFGRNATGGLIHVVSAKPTDAFEGYGEFTYGSYSQKKFEGALSGPLSDSVRGRLSVAGNFHDGVAENRIGPDPRAADTIGVRAQLEVDLGERAALTLKGFYSGDDSLGNAYTHVPIGADADGLGYRLGPEDNYWGTCGGCDPNGFRDSDDDPFEGSYDEPGYFERDIASGTAKLAWDITDTVTLTSITDYLTLDKQYREDTDGSPLPYFIFSNSQDFDQFSQEVRLNGNPNERLHWTAGAYFLDIDHEGEELDFLIDFGGLFFGPGALGSADNHYSGPTSNTVETESWAVFGHVEVDVSERLRVIAALRYTEDDKSVDFVSSDVLGPNFWGGPPGAPPFVIPFALAEDPDAHLFDMDFENVSGKFELDWHVTDATMVYASFNRGHKGGSSRVPAGGNPTQPISTFPHDEEVLHSVEGGVKSTFAEGRARLNASVYYYDYKDYQAFITVPDSLPAALSIVNLDAEAFGAEVELLVTPTDRWSLSLGVAAMDSEIPDVPLPSGRLVDRELPYAPNLAVNGLVRYEWPAFGGTLALQGDFTYSDNFCFTVLCAPVDREGSYFIGNVRATYFSPDDRWRVTAFVNNVGDEAHRLYSLDISGLGIANDAYALPRWAGATVSMFFK